MKTPKPKQKPKHADVLKDPTAHFPAPAEVVADATRSLKEKREILSAWETDARLLSVAGDEGMTGGESARLDEVKKAQGELPGKPVRDGRSPTKAG